MATKKDQETGTETLGTPEGRFYLPSSEAPKDDTSTAPGTPEGRFYLPSGQSSTVSVDVGDPSAQTVQEEPVAAASTLAGDPPTKEDVKAAKADARAVEAGAAAAPVDAAAQTTQPEPVAAASQLAGDPVVGEPKGNASRDEWEAYARSKGAVDADLVDADGHQLSRDQLREKYGSPSS